MDRYLTLLLTGIVYALAIGAGMIALIIPGIFISIKLFFYDAAIIIEGDDLSGSLKRSWQIVQGNWWRLFALFLLLTLPGLIVSFSENIIPAPVYGLTFILASGFLFVWTQAVSCYAYLSLKEIVVSSELTKDKE